MAVDTAQLANPTASLGAGLQSLYGQGVVGKQVSCPWLTGGPYEVTQGWGPTSVQSEPAEDRQGKHYSHWHAGVDLSNGSITSAHLVFPHGLGQQATAIYLNNPQGYGTALILRVFTQSYAGKGGGTAQVRSADILKRDDAGRYVAHYRGEC